MAISCNLIYTYQGAAKGKDNELLNKKYGKGGATLLCMLDSLPQSIKSLPINFFIDNYLTSLPLVATLGERGYSCTGTLRDNRIPKSCPIMMKKAMKKKECGSITTVYDKKNKLAVILWKDNAVVAMASSLAHDQPLQKVHHWSSKDKKRIMVSQPYAVHLYNKAMGGTDKADKSVSLYRTKIRRKKWWWPLFTWMLDVTVVNSWLLHQQDGHPDTSLLDFRRVIAVALIQSELSCRE